MYGYIVVVMNIGKTLIPCAGVLVIVHAHNMYGHPIEYFSLDICMGVDGSGFSELVIQQ